MTNAMNKRSSGLFKTEVLDRLFRFKPRYHTGKSIMKKLRRHLNNHQSLFAVQHLRDSIFFHAPAKVEGGKAVGFAAPRENADSSFLPLLVSLAFGGLKHNRVLFIDGRFDQQLFSLCSNLFALTPGQFKHMNGCGSFNCYSTPNQALSFLTAKGKTDALELFSDGEIAGLIHDMRQQFDYVIFDMPPVLNSSETRMLLSRLDLFYLTCKAGVTRYDDVKLCQEVVAAAGGAITGAVMTEQSLPFWASFIGRDAFL